MKSKIKTTVQEALNKNAAKVAAWDEAHTESTYTQAKPYLKWLWMFAYTSAGIWLKALFTGKMSWKNIGLVLATSIPLYIAGYYVGVYVWADLGVTLFYIGHTIFWGAALLLLPVNGIKIMFWMMVHGTGNSTTTHTTTTTTRYVKVSESGVDENGFTYYNQ